MEECIVDEDGRLRRKTLFDDDDDVESHKEDESDDSEVRTESWRNFAACEFVGQFFAKYARRCCILTGSRRRI